MSAAIRGTGIHGLMGIGGAPEGVLTAAAMRAAVDTAVQHGDMDTSDLFTEVSRELDKALWFLEAHLQK